MKYTRSELKWTVSALLAATVLCLQMPLAAKAEDAQAQASQTEAAQTQAETPLLDLTQIADPDPAKHRTDILLNGEIRRSVKAQGQSQEETPSADEELKFQLALKKLRSREKMTSEDYRDLQIGIVGCNTVRHIGKGFARVEEVVPGTPAAQAGIRKGDVQILRPDEEWHPKDPTHSIWLFSGGRAGSKVNMTFLRQGQEVSVSLTRMNIEDLPDAKIRRQYESWARKLGPSGDGTVALPDQSPLLLKLAKHLI
jgi:C-terminal processing protease CtpA/Prc